MADKALQFTGSGGLDAASGELVSGETDVPTG